MTLELELHKDELDQLPEGAKMILTAACTQRHAVNYHTFAGGTHSRRSKQFDAILDAIWLDIGHDRLSTDQLEKLPSRAERLHPDEGPYAPYAGYPDWLSRRSSYVAMQPNYMGIVPKLRILRSEPSSPFGRFCVKLVRRCGCQMAGFTPMRRQ